MNQYTLVSKHTFLGEKGEIVGKGNIEKSHRVNIQEYTFISYHHNLKVVYHFVTLLERKIQLIKLIKLQVNTEDLFMN